MNAIVPTLILFLTKYKALSLRSKTTSSISHLYQQMRTYPRTTRDIRCVGLYGKQWNQTLAEQCSQIVRNNVRRPLYTHTHHGHTETHSQRRTRTCWTRIWEERHQSHILFKKVLTSVRSTLRDFSTQSLMGAVECFSKIGIWNVNGAQGFYTSLPRGTGGETLGWQSQAVMFL